MRLVFFLLVAWRALVPASVLAGDTLPREPSDLLLIGDSVTAGIYFLQLDQESMAQAWSGQLLLRLGIDVPKAPFDNPYPIDHLALARDGFGWTRLGYAWQARRILKGKSKYDAAEERVVLAIPGQTVREVLEQSSDTDDLNRGSSGWTFANILLPKHMSVIATVESWKKQPRWIVVFIGANDLLASFGMAGRATPVTPDEFHRYYSELTRRLRAKMAPGSPPEQLILLTLPDVTTLPFLQDLPVGADDGAGHRYPEGSQASTFLIPYRDHFDGDEVWTPDELAAVRRQVTDYNAGIVDIARAGGFTVINTNTLMSDLAGVPGFSTPYSLHFSPDLQHPSYRTHAAIATAVLDTMASIAGEPVPPRSDEAHPLPDASQFAGDARDRMDAMMHLAVQALRSGPLPPRPTARVAVEAAVQRGDERVGDFVFPVAATVELAPAPVSARYVIRLGLGARAAVAALHSSGEEADFFPKRSPEARLGAAFEPVGMWHWQRVEVGGLMTLDRYRDGGYYIRGEWRVLYADLSSRGWEPDRLEVGLRLGTHLGRPGRNGN